MTTAADWLTAERAARLADDAHRPITPADLTPPDITTDTQTDTQTDTDVATGRVTGAGGSGDDAVGSAPTAAPRSGEPETPRDHDSGTGTPSGGSHEHSTGEGTETAAAWAPAQVVDSDEAAKAAAEGAQAPPLPRLGVTDADPARAGRILSAQASAAEILLAAHHAARTRDRLADDTSLDAHHPDDTTAEATDEEWLYLTRRAHNSASAAVDEIVQTQDEAGHDTDAPDGRGLVDIDATA